MNVFPEKFRFSFIRNGVTTYCRQAPEEWNDNVIKWSRDKKNNTILTNYVNNFSFVLEDAEYLKNCFLEETVFAKVRFVAEEYDYDKFEYKPYYSGDIDFYSYEEEEYKVNVTMLELSYKVMFDANYDTTYDLDIPLEDVIHVNYDRLIMHNTLKYSFEFNQFNPIPNKDFVAGWYVADDENITCKLISYKSVEQEERNKENWLLQATSEVDLNIKLSPSGAFSFASLKKQNSSASLLVKLWINDIEIEVKEIIYKSFGFPSFPNGYSAQPQNDVKFNRSLKRDDKVHITLTLDDNFESLLIESKLYVEYESRDKSKYIYGVRPIHLLKQLISKITDAKYNLIKSSFLTNTEINNLLITSGDLIRSGSKNVKIRTSLKDFFETMKAIGGGAYVFDKVDGQERLVVEHVNDLFKKNKKLISVDNINELKKSVANDYIYNRLKIGFKNQNYDEINGKNEFSTELEFSIITGAKSKELKLISPYRADMYGIEFTIINYKDENKDSVDSESDNDIFMIHISEDKNNGEYSVNRTLKANNSPAGESAFNVYLSPYHCLMRQIEYINSLFKYSGNILKFSSSPKNFELESDLGKEHKDIVLGNYTNLFDPVFYEFETRVPENISELLEEGYNGYVEVKTPDKIIKGFIFSLSQNPGRDKSQKWKILAVSE